MITLSSMVLESRGENTVSNAYYVRAIDAGRPLFGDTAQGRDAWAAYHEEPVWVALPGRADLVCLMRVERISSAPRFSLEEAAMDMRAAVALHLERGAKLFWGAEGGGEDEGPLLGADPMGDAE